MKDEMKEYKYWSWRLFWGKLVWLCNNYTTTMPILGVLLQALDMRYYLSYLILALRQSLYVKADHGYCVNLVLFDLCDIWRKNTLLVMRMVGPASS